MDHNTFINVLTLKTEFLERIHPCNRVVDRVEPQIILREPRGVKYPKVAIIKEEKYEFLT